MPTQKPTEPWRLMLKIWTTNHTMCCLILIKRGYVEVHSNRKTLSCVIWRNQHSNLCDTSGTHSPANSSLKRRLSYRRSSQKLKLNSPSLIAEHAVHLTPLPDWVQPWFWWYTYCFNADAPSQGRDFESIWDKLSSSSSSASRIWIWAVSRACQRAKCLLTNQLIYRRSFHTIFTNNEICIQCDLISEWPVGMLYQQEQPMAFATQIQIIWSHCLFTSSN